MFKHFKKITWKFLFLRVNNKESIKTYYRASKTTSNNLPLPRFEIIQKKAQKKLLTWVSDSSLILSSMHFELHTFAKSSFLLHDLLIK